MKSDKIAEQEDRIEKARKNEQRLTLLKATWAEEEPFLAEQEAKIVSGDHVAWFWRHLGDFAEKEKMASLAIVPESPSKDGLPDSGEYERAGASLTLNCGYHKLGDFLQNLENAFSTLQVRHVEIIADGKGSPGSHTVRLQFQLLAKNDDDRGEGSDKDQKFAQLSSDQK